MTKKLKSATPIATNPHAAQKSRQAARDRRATRKAQLIRLLSRKTGADVSTISKAFGWQPNTTRAALSRLRKDGHEVIRDASGSGKPARYRIQQKSPGKAARASVKKATAGAR